MKSRKLKVTAKSKAFMSKKKLRGNISLNVDSGSDVDSDSFYHDEIDDFHREQEEELSTDDELIGHNNDILEEQEEVLPITDDENNESDAADKEENELPNVDAWGKKKSWYYNADFVDEDRGRSYREKDAEAAKAEEDEALAIQKSLVSGISSRTFESFYSKFEGSEESSEDLEEKSPDWNAISAPEKLRLLKKTSPELLVFIEEFKKGLVEGKDRLAPLIELMKKGTIHSKACEKYVILKYQLLLHFCMNISFYMVLKSQGSLMCNHPVLQRISAYKNLLDQLKPIDDKLNPEIDIIVEKLKAGKEIEFKTTDPDMEIDEHIVSSVLQNNFGKKQIVEAAVKSKKLKNKQYETEAEKEILSLYMEMREQKKDKDIESLEEMDDDQEKSVEDNAVEEKRTITYQIAKNKGLIARRKKEYRNPRVRHRMKFRKAKIRRKGQVREVTREVKRYEGEPSGISTHVVRSIKLK